jgi:hypothetical protein
MTINTTTSKPSTTQIHAIFHDSIIQNNGEIHLSQFEEPNRPDDFAAEDDEKMKKNKNKQNVREDIFNVEDDNLLLNAEELEELEDTTYHNNSKKNTINKTTSTNDNDKKLPATSTSNLKPPNQEEIISKARYRYGRKGSMITSTFKKYQPPFKTKQNISNPTNNENPNPINNENQNDDIDQLITIIIIIMTMKTPILITSRTKRKKIMKTPALTTLKKIAKPSTIIQSELTKTKKSKQITKTTTITIIILSQLRHIPATKF